MSTFPKLSELKRVHIIGICGTLMAPFACFLKRQGIEVSGSDQNIYPPMSDLLQKAQVKLFSGYRAENLKSLSQKPDLVVVGNVIPRVNPEAVEALEGGYRYVSLPEVMENILLSETRNLIVSGTHGKTTTSSLLSYTLVKCGSDPSYFIGGVPQDLPYSFHVASLEKGHPFVLEGDEYDTVFWDKVPKFFHYLPDDVILTSVEFDHADIYADLAAVKKAFVGLMERIRPAGKVIACADDPNVMEVVSRARVPVLTYGMKAGQYRAKNINVQGDKTSFEIWDEKQANQPCDRVQLKISGEYNILNALAVWIECRQLELNPAKVREAFLSFSGVKRRQEVRADVGGILVIDDFAHHPTAVRETLRGLKLRYPGRRLLAVFEPRSATSRRKIFQSDYVQAFLEADLIFIAKPYDQSKISEDQQFSSEQFVSDLNRAGRESTLFDSVDEGVQQVVKKSNKNDIIAILSNGGFGGFVTKTIDFLKKTR